MELITGRNPVDYSRPQGEVRPKNNTIWFHFKALFKTVVLDIVLFLVIGEFG